MKAKIARGIINYSGREILDIIAPSGFRLEMPQGQRMPFARTSTVVPMTGGAGTVTATGARLAKKFIIGVTGIVLTTVTGAGLTTLNIGDGTDADRYGAAIAVAQGTTFAYTNATADPREWLVAAGNIVFTAVAGVISAGSIRLDLWHIDLTAPTIVA